jgi:hypothetical protein
MRSSRTRTVYLDLVKTVTITIPEKLDEAAASQPTG